MDASIYENPLHVVIPNKRDKNRHRKFRDNKEVAEI